VEVEKLMSIAQLTYVVALLVPVGILLLMLSWIAIMVMPVLVVLAVFVYHRQVMGAGRLLVRKTSVLMGLQ
jgi:hypothetical protein